MILHYGSALPEDLDRIHMLNRQLVDTYEDLTSIDYPKVMDWMRRNAEQNISHFTRIYCNGQLAGYYCLTQEDGIRELDSLFIFPEFQNQGIGTAVLKKSITESDLPVFLYVFKANTGAYRLYRRMGFQVVKEFKTRYIMSYEKQGC